MRSRYWTEIVATATVFALDPILVEAVVVQESSGNTDAFRFEPAFYDRYIKISPDWEWARKKYANPRRMSSSYGLMQIMWPVALEDGFPRESPPELLFVPEIGLKWGCTRLRTLVNWADKGWPQVAPTVRLRAILASYNGGRGGNRPTDMPLRNTSYANSVLKTYTQLQAEHAQSL